MSHLDRAVFSWVPCSLFRSWGSRLKSVIPVYVFLSYNARGRWKFNAWWVLYSWISWPRCRCSLSTYNITCLVYKPITVNRFRLEKAFLQLSLEPKPCIILANLFCIRRIRWRFTAVVTSKLQSQTFRGTQIECRMQFLYGHYWYALLFLLIKYFLKLTLLKIYFQHLLCGLLIIGGWLILALCCNLSLFYSFKFCLESSYFQRRWR